MESEYETISIIIPTLNAAARLPGLIAKLQSQSRKPDEIIVVDSSSDDNTQEIVSNHEGVVLKVVGRNDFNHGITRHEALLESKGDFVCFMTDDAVPANASFLANLFHPMKDSQIAVVSGRQLPRNDARKYERYVREYNYRPESSVRSIEDIPSFGLKTFFATDVCSIYRREAYLAVGGFERVNTNEDMLIAARFINAGYKVAYEASAEVFHSHDYKVREEFNRNKEIGRFLMEHEKDLGGLSEMGEGVALVKEVSLRLIEERDILELLAFGVDCAARLAGNRVGRRLAKKQGQAS